MDHFLTSFFKIRVVAMVLAFFLLCFLVGLLKSAFAGYQDSGPIPHIDPTTGDCLYSGIQIEWTDYYTNNYHYDAVSTEPWLKYSKGQYYSSAPFIMWRPIVQKWNGTSWISQLHLANGSFATTNMNLLSQSVTALSHYGIDGFTSNAIPSEYFNNQAPPPGCGLSVNANLGSPNLCPVP